MKNVLRSKGCFYSVRSGIIHDNLIQGFLTVCVVIYHQGVALVCCMQYLLEGEPSNFMEIFKK